MQVRRTRAPKIPDIFRVEVISDDLAMFPAGVHQANRAVPLQHELGGPRGDG